MGHLLCSHVPTLGGGAVPLGAAARDAAAASALERRPCPLCARGDHAWRAHVISKRDFGRHAPPLL
jgi:hypothetical protein